MPMLMLHFFAACPQIVSLWTAKFAAFCTGDGHKAPHYAVSSLIAKIMELIVSLLRDTATKACRSSDDRTKP
jgi:hypothetical protein